MTLFIYRSRFASAGACLCLWLASCGDSELERRLEQAVEESDLPRASPETNGSAPGFDGFVKSTDDSGAVSQLYELKDGQLDGPAVGWDK